MRPAPRAFRLGDLMALVAATAGGLALDRWRLAELEGPPPGITGISTSTTTWLSVLEMGAPSCLVVALAVVLIPLRWLGPRPSAGRVLRQPGAVAALAIVGSILASFAVWKLGFVVAAVAGHGPGQRNIFSHQYVWSYVARSVAWGLEGTWIALTLGGRWSPERSWIDRTGIALGVYWILLDALGFLGHLIQTWLPYKA